MAHYYRPLGPTLCARAADMLNYRQGRSHIGGPASSTANGALVNWKRDGIVSLYQILMPQNKENYNQSVIKMGN